MIDVIKQRHSVRQYIDKPLEKDIIDELQREIDACNDESGLHIQLVTNEPKAFDSFMAHYGKFEGVTNYIVLVGKKGSRLNELCGYYGERLVLKAQQLGLNTCWVAMTYKKITSAFTIARDEKLTVVIALGYGRTQGVPHKSKSIEQVADIDASTPEWFKSGVEAALLAPTAMNQQKFKLGYNDGRVSAKSGIGFYTEIDLGIAKYHFEIGANRKVDWV